MSGEIRKTTAKPGRLMKRNISAKADRQMKRNISAKAGRQMKRIDHADRDRLLDIIRSSKLHKGDKGEIRNRSKSKGFRRKTTGKTARKMISKPTGCPLDRALTFVAKRFVRAGGTKLLIAVFPYLMFAYFGNKIAYACRISPAPDFFNKLVGGLGNLSMAFKTVLPSLHPVDVLLGAVVGVIMKLVVYCKGKNAKKFRKGVEYGSARWGEHKDIEPFMDLENPDNNIILTQTEGLIMNGRPKDQKCNRNKNCLIIGANHIIGLSHLTFRKRKAA